MTGLDPALTAYLAEVVRRVSGRVGDALAGVWVIGSAAAGAYERGVSDLDVAVAVDRGLSNGDRRALEEALPHHSLPCPARRLELVVYRREVLAAPAELLGFELNLNTGAGLTDHVTADIADESPHWFLLDLAIARERSLALAGPPLADLLGPIPEAAILDALRTSVDWFDANEPDRASVVLAACRAWRYAADRRFGTKAQAATWVAATDTALAGTVSRALALRRRVTTAPLAEADVAAVLDRARRALA